MQHSKTTSLNAHFGLEIHDYDLRKAAHDDGEFAHLRDAFDRHTALLFRAQDFGDADHLALARRFGPIENRETDTLEEGDAFKISQVSNETADGGVTGEMDMHTLNLKANFLWHTDSIFLPVPALVNILIGRVVTESGGQTELASTRAAWAAMPDDIKNRLKDATIWHKLSHSRAQISPELAELPMFHKWDDQHWKALWRNPVTGEDALYFASHSFRVDGLSEAESKILLDQAMAFCTQKKFTYSHQWQEGDILIWDERAALHRGQPWDYTKPRTLSSICTSATSEDGLDSIRV
ncbi:TauD/TfdA dioxygenase family protein [Halocynthiibacter namhaensis]|uniref:TauD/TfdA dioxygenase family protein n=1 Tax=Halocynthiibacter namhaensis TaxID=1290553 RepID=UPI000578FD97|nr:TauD/TfdA family dioxygenase [Halocynthiibacter namhaensis]